MSEVSASDDLQLDLDAVRGAFDEGRDAWPGFEVAFSAFAVRMAGGRNRAHASDLYLACACSEANPIALLEFERRFIARVGEVVAHIDPSYDFVAEVEQMLRERLLVGPSAKIRDYRGAGPLRAWVRTAAIRTALNLRRSHDWKQLDAPSVEPFERLLDPEVALLRHRYAPEIDGALRRALGLLGPADRRLLHHYYVDGHTLARIASLEGIGTTTVFRRLNAAAQAALGHVRADLAARLHLSSQSVEGLYHLVRRDLQLSVSRILT